jgi:CRP-like cAMP-binding protein
MATLTLTVPMPGIAPLPARSVTRSYLGHRFENQLAISGTERDALDRWLVRSVRRVSDRTALVEQGAPPSDLYIVLDGWCCRYRAGTAGPRQVVAIHLPGDVCDFNSFVAQRMDSTVEAVGELTVGCVSRSALNEITAAHPRLSQGLWWDSMVASSTAREWLFSLGQRNARQRVAHLLCELYQRLANVGLASGGAMPMPLTQGDLGSACGMTPEHTNRTLRELRESGLIGIEPRTMHLRDRDALEEIAGFNPDYLHFAAPPLG